MELFNTATEKLTGKIVYRHSYVDFSNLEVSFSKDGEYDEVIKTCPAAMGFAFAAGTTDGPGAFDFKQGDNKVTRSLVLLIHYCGTVWTVDSKPMWFVLLYLSDSLSGECLLEFCAQLAENTN